MEEVARLTGLEPATPGVTGRYSNQLSYNRAMSGYLAAEAGGVKQECARGLRQGSGRVRVGRVAGDE